MKTNYLALILVVALLHSPGLGIAQSPIVLNANLTQVLCANAGTGAIDLQVSGGTPGYTYQWQNMSGNNDPEDRTQLYAGTYCVTVTDAVGQTASRCFDIADPECGIFFKSSLLPFPLVALRLPCWPMPLEEPRLLPIGGAMPILTSKSR